MISPEDLLDEMNIHGKGDLQIINKNEKMLETTENLVYSCLGFFPKGISQLLEETGFCASELLQILTSLELKGYIREVSKNYYSKTR